MAMVIPDSIQRLLMEQGLVPKHCSRVELVMPANGAMVLKYEVFVTTDDMAKLAVAFQGMAAKP